MTWAGLCGALRACGAIRVEAGLCPEATPEVSGVTYDSRHVEPGAVFVALKGLRSDGAAFIGQAIARRAVAIVSEQAALSLRVFEITGVQAIHEDCYLRLAAVLERKEAGADAVRAG